VTDNRLKFYTMKKNAGQSSYGPKSFSIDLIQNMLVALGREGFSPGMAKEITKARSGKAKKIVTLFEESESWLKEILEQKRLYDIHFFGRVFNLSKSRKALKKCGYQKILEWRKAGLEPFFFPKYQGQKDGFIKK